MLHGRFRTTLCWTLFLMLLAGMVLLLEELLPPQPRWSIKAPLFFHGITPDSRAVITTRRQPVNDSRPPLKALDTATGQELARVFPDAFDINFKIAVPPDGKESLIWVQLTEGAPWELHLLNTTTFSTRRLPWPVPGAATHFVDPLPNATLVSIYPRVHKEHTPFEKTLLDYESGISHTWRHEQFLTSFLVNGPMVFFGSVDGIDTQLTFWDRRDKQAKTNNEGRAPLRISGDQRRAVTTRPAKEGKQTVKLWDLATGNVLTETLTEEGSVNLSDDGAWAMIGSEEHAVPNMAAPDPADRGNRAAFWNLVESRRIGECPWERADWFDVISEQGQLRLLILAQNKSELQLRDALTLKTIWARNWPNWDHLRYRDFSTRAMREYVAFSNDLEQLDLSNGQTRSFITLARPRYHAQVGGPSLRNDTFDSSVSPDGRFAILETRFVVNDVPIAEQWLAALRNALGIRGNLNELVQLNVIDLANAKLLLQTPNYADRPLERWELSPDGQSLLVNSFTGDDDNTENILECWDLPARKPWPWILGIPLAFGVCGLLARWTWRRWRRRPNPLPDGRGSDS